jgi:hypothetical protein
MSVATGAAGAMTFPQHLVLWAHVAFVIFTIGPLTLAIMSTPRYVRQHNLTVVRYLSRITFVCTLASLGVLIAGAALAQMLKVSGKPWLIVSLTLFLVAIVLLALIVRDQRRAIRALEEAAELTVGQPVATVTPAEPVAAEGTAADVQADDPAPTPAQASPPQQVATVERGRIAMLGGVVGLIYLVVLVLMVWNG